MYYHIYKEHKVREKECIISMCGLLYNNKKERLHNLIEYCIGKYHLF
jgi:hypothetical protein